MLYRVSVGVYVGGLWGKEDTWSFPRKEKKGLSFFEFPLNSNGVHRIIAQAY